MGIQNYSKYSFDGLITVPLANSTVSFWHRLGFKPNGITTIHILLKILILALIIQKSIPALTIVGLTMLIVYFDALDGIMARKYDQGSQLGAVLDCGSDFVFWATFVVIMLLRVKGPSKILLILILFVALISWFIYFVDPIAQPGFIEYVWSAASWNLVPIMIILGIPLMKSAF